MAEDYSDLAEYLKSIETYKLPEYKDIPSIPLYMEQVVGYINEVIGKVVPSESLLTPFMVNNYVKAKIIDAPVAKKYNSEQMAYLISIGLLKNAVSMRDLTTLIDMDSAYSTDTSKLYELFKKLQDDAINKTAHRVKMRLTPIQQNQKNKTKKTNDSLNLAYVALSLYVESETSKIIADKIMEKLSSLHLSPEAFNETRKETKLEKKKTKTEASKLKGR